MRRNGWLLDQLPGHMADDEFLTRFLSIFQDVATSLVNRADEFEHLIDPTVAPPEFVRYMGSWLGAAIDEALPIERQREFVDAAGDTIALRGTRQGVAAILQTVTLGEVEVVDEGGTFAQEAVPPNDKHVVVTIEHLGETPWEKLVALVAGEIPVDCTFELRIAGDDDPLYDGRPVTDEGPTQDAEASDEEIGDDGETGDAEASAEEHHGSRLHDLTKRVDELLASTLHKAHDLPHHHRPASDDPEAATDHTVADQDSVESDEQKRHWWQRRRDDSETDGTDHEEESSGDV